MGLVSESAAVLMSAGSRQVLLAPTHTCTCLTTCLVNLRQTWSLYQPCQYTWTVYIYFIFLSVSLKRHPCLSCRKQSYCFVYTSGIPTVPPPEEKSLEGGQTALGCTVQYLAGGVPVCLFYSGSQPVIWGEIRAVWDFKRCGREWVELPVFAVWSFDSYVSKQSRHIRLRAVWCWNLWKKKSNEMYFGVFYVFKLTFGEVEMNSYHIVRVFTVSELVKLK